MVLFWFFGAYLVEICGKLGTRMKFVSRHVGCRTFFDCFMVLWKKMNSSQILHNFPLVYTLSFQKSNTCPEKILDIKKLFKIFIKFPLRSPTFVRNFWNFRSKFRSYNLQLITFPKRYFASKLTNKLPRYHQENVEKQEKIE